MKPRNCARCGDLRAAVVVAFHTIGRLGPLRARGRAFDVCALHVRDGETSCKRPASLSALNVNMARA